MDDLRFYKKKRMLARRDDLLEEIGEVVYESGDLPPRFADLHREFRGLDALLRQLWDRKLALQRDFDRLEEDYSIQQKELAKLESAHLKEIKPHRKARDELALKRRHHKDRMVRAPRPRQKPVLEDLERRYRNLEQTVDMLEKDHRRKIAAFQAELEPLEQRREKLNRGIRNVEEERIRLKTSRQRRLRDLGHYYFEKRIDEANFGVKYGQLKILKLELAHSRQEHVHEDFSPVRKPKENQWKWVWLVILAAVLTGYLFRTEFREEEVNLEALAMPFLSDHDWRIFINLAEVDRLAVSPYLPNLQALPGGTAFRDFTTEDIVSLATSGRQPQTPTFLGVSLRRQPSRFANRLRELGWQHRRIPGEWLALSKDDWVWVMLNPRQYVLVHQREVPKLQHDNVSVAADDLLLAGTWPPFNSNKPVLAGADRFELRLKGVSATLAVSFSKEPVDWGLRKQLLRARRGRDGLPFKIQVADKALVIQCPRDAFTPPTYNADDLQDLVESFMRQYLREGRLPIAADNQPDNTEIPTAANQMALKDTQAETSGAWPSFEPFAEDRSSNYRIDAYLQDVEQIRRISSANFGEDITGMAFLGQYRSLLVADGGAGTLAMMPFRRQRLQGAHTVDLSGSERGLGVEQSRFQPSFLSVDPKQRFAVLAGNTSHAERPLLVLVDLASMRVVWREELPRTVFGIRSAVWSPDGERLYLGCAAKGRRNQTALALLDYQHANGILQLTSLVDLPVANMENQVVADIGLNQKTGHLYLWRVPQRQFVRIPIDAMGAGEYPTFEPLNHLIDDGMVVNSGRMVMTRHRDQLLLSLNVVDQSTQDRALFALLDVNQAFQPMNTLSLAVSPEALYRVPLSNRYWATLSGKPHLVRLRIHNQAVQLDLSPADLTVHPQWVAMDPFGDFLFLAGKPQLSTNAAQ